MTFDVEGRYVVFCHAKEHMVSSSSSILNALSLYPEIDMEDVFNSDDPPNSEWISYENLDQRYVKVEFPVPTPPNIPKVEVPMPNESSISNYCRFTQAVPSVPPMEGFVGDFDLGVEQVDSDQPDRARACFILYADNALWRQVMKTKDL